MKKPNIDSAWEILVSRKSERRENRPAFIAALIAEKCGAQAHIAEAFAVELVRLAVAIHSLCEHDCNHGLSEQQEKRQTRLEERFAGVATALGFEARTGGDPRGACAYLIDPDKRTDGDGFGYGWAVYR